jgi:predicted DNA-binding protein
MNTNTRDKPLGVRVPRELHRRLKVAAAESGRPMAEIVEAALREYLNRVEG